ncbi:MAG TPA: CheR family methyltransferase [Polyangiaceae bacterium]|jgi:chemotaxis protein methyltransferase CheR|nr:CheR family methyltransferase [Polyangiaceae bacterium]
MQTEVLRAFQRLAHQQAGISLKDSKSALVAARIARRMRELGLNDASQYLGYIESDKDGTEMVHFLDSITTNFTNFFREPDHFDVLAEEAREFARAGGRRMRVWCAAASTGEEPYSLAMTLAETFKNTAADYRVLATDLSSRVLRFAANGAYEASRLAQVPKAFRSRYFQAATVGDSGEATYRVGPEIRDRVVFGRLNLAFPPFPLRGEFDVIFCRNVMIYFDAPVRARLIAEMERLLRPGGLLVVAHSETLGRTRGGFTPLRSSVYRKAAS